MCYNILYICSIYIRSISYSCMYVYIYTYVYIYICIYICIYVCVWLCVIMCVMYTNNAHIQGSHPYTVRDSSPPRTSASGAQDPTPFSSRRWNKASNGAIPPGLFFRKGIGTSTLKDKDKLTTSLAMSCHMHQNIIKRPSRLTWPKWAWIKVIRTKNKSTPLP